MTDPARVDDACGENADAPDRSGHGWDDPRADSADPDDSGRTPNGGTGSARTDAGPDGPPAPGSGDDAGLGRRQRLGLALLVAGVALFVVPAPGILETETRLLIAGVATGALILGLVYAGDERVTSHRFWRPPDPEPGSEIPRPGESFERLSGSALDERIRAAAIDVLTDATGCSEETAESRLASGAWTSDGLAAAALSEAVRPRLRRRLRARLTGADLDRRARERALAELAAIRAGRRSSGRAPSAGSETTNRGGRRGFDAVEDSNVDLDGGTDRDGTSADRADATGSLGGWGTEREDGDAEPSDATDREVLDP
ncbi:DUF7269 family protein [Halovivax limisalsi]|uniref:DUF7269 family protein n=1 Tax=Halovivax limisalsi TaxID=1453760 RepID=UPI001FFC9542|nr:hypothetical protein [Halovivax limisalsi]